MTTYDDVQKLTNLIINEIQKIKDIKILRLIFEIVNSLQDIIK